VIQLVFFDVDGTLLGRDGHYSQALKNQIQRIQKQGVRTAIASGRPPFACEFLFRELNLTATGVFFTGALIYDPEQQKTLFEASIDKALLSRLLKDISAASIYCELYTDRAHFVAETSELSQSHGAHLRASANTAELASFTDKSAAATLKLLIGVDERERPDALQALAARFPQCHFAYARFPAWPNWLFASVIASGADKTKAFERLLAHHQVSAEQVMAFGDAGSDKTFLQLAGKGIAMGNADEDVKAVADEVTLPVWEDGIAHSLATFIPES